MHNKFGRIELGETVWIHDEKLLNQWLKVLRFTVKDELILFNDEEERLYKISDIEFPHSVKLKMVTELERKFSTKKVTLIWSLLKKDKNDWVLQKATELGVHEFVPVIADRSEKTGFNLDRAKKIVIEASEQCGRSDIPIVRDSVFLNEALAEYKDSPLFVCEQHNSPQIQVNDSEPIAVLIGPEGGWTDKEKEQFKKLELNHLAISQFTLRAETAAVVSVAKLI
jgi:16S rRNA (uracil1498-N3)-methyltransferase